MRFLGTGPAGGRPGCGRSRRLESSLAVICDDGALLIDVTRDLSAQRAQLGDVPIEMVLLTHGHRDACGGVAMLDRTLPSRVPLLASRATLRTLRARHRALPHLALHAASTGRVFAWRGWQLTPLAVPHARDCTTFAWRLARRGFSLVYASDVARLTRGLVELARGCDLLVLDGAMWRRTLFTHLEIQATAPIVAGWPVGRVLFTQLGRSTPDHEALDTWLRACDPRLGAAYDGLELPIVSTSAARGARPWQPSGRPCSASTFRAPP